MAQGTHMMNSLKQFISYIYMIHPYRFLI